MIRKISSWNVNGIRAAANKGFSNWIQIEKPDVLCLQEVKAFRDQVSPEITDPAGYSSYWHSAKKPGYSGVAIYIKDSLKPSIQRIEEGMGYTEFDQEGRVLAIELDIHWVVSAYFPNSQREGLRLPYKLSFGSAIADFLKKIEKNSGKPVVLSGDYNIAHEEIDLRNPKQNMQNAGFLPEERKWMSEFIGNGYVDTFRHFEKSGGHYSWWSYRPGVREKNIGWRIDYHCVSKPLLEQVESAWIQPDVYGSDHCPVGLALKDTH